MNSRLARVGGACALLLIVSCALWETPVARDQVRAAALLARLSGDTGRVAHIDAHAVDVSQVFEIASLAGPVRARTYMPKGVAHPHGIVVVHGVHQLGIEEPRLVAFARAISESGIAVMTPELRDLADYRITTNSTEAIGAAANAFRAQLGEPVGVLGLSFAGGLSVLAASDARFAKHVAFVVSVGGHDDLARVCRFFAMDETPSPDGTVQKLGAHEYGALVMVYAHPEDFFPTADVPAARVALRLQLWEKLDDAKAAAAKLSPAGRVKLELLLDPKRRAELRPELLALIARHADDMAKVSPHGNTAGLRAPVLVLHGAGDTVIPATEALWLERDTAAHTRARLITPLLTHVDMGAAPPLRERMQLINFIATMLQLTEMNHDFAR